MTAKIDAFIHVPDKDLTDEQRAMIVQHMEGVIEAYNAVGAGLATYGRIMAELEGGTPDEHIRGLLSGGNPEILVRAGLRALTHTP